jgi:hypothetical protein
MQYQDLGDLTNRPRKKSPRPSTLAKVSAEIKTKLAEWNLTLV